MILLHGEDFSLPLLNEGSELVLFYYNIPGQLAADSVFEIINFYPVHLPGVVLDLFKV